MAIQDKKVSVYHVTPLCRKCDDELSKVQRASDRAGVGVDVRFSLWKRIKYGLRFLSMPVVVIEDKAFSVLGAFGEEALIAELKKNKKEAAPGAR
jgi:hypothetical protein